MEIPIPSARALLSCQKCCSSLWSAQAAAGDLPLNFLRVMLCAGEQGRTGIVCAILCIDGFRYAGVQLCFHSKKIIKKKKKKIEKGKKIIRSVPALTVL